MPTKHYEFGGSTAARDLQCPAWRLLSKDLPKGGSSSAADRGTALHDCMELLLNDPDLSYNDLLGRQFGTYTVTQDDIDTAIVPALNAYLAFADDVDIILELPEIEVVKNERTGGTVDVFAANEDTVIILDWKFGYINVDAEENEQALFYAMCARHDPKTAAAFHSRRKLMAVIVQPQSERVLKKWDFDIDYLSEFEKDHESETLHYQDINNPIIGPACKFCPASTFCPAKTGLARKALMLDPNSAEAQQLPDLLTLSHTVQQWAKDVQNFAHDQAKLGVKIDGYKLVDKRATRKWDDADAVLNMIKAARSLKLEEGTNITLKSPTQLEKVCNKKGIDFEKYAKHIIKESSGTTLVPEDDKRIEAINFDAFKHAVQLN